MTLIDQLGIALGLSTLAGINLYLTVLVAGCAIRFQWLKLGETYEQMAVFGNSWVLGIAAALFVIEFFADKIPWLDSLWDSVHTLIRPAGGIFLALAVLGDLDPAMTVIAVLLAGTASLSTHGVKAGLRTVLNLSPEPVSNAVASVAEDGLVIGGLGLIALSPLIALLLFFGVVVLSAALAIWLWKRIFRMRRKILPARS